MEDDTLVGARTPLLKHATTDDDVTMGHASWSTEDELDGDFGGTLARQELEKKLLWKVDKRMSILVLIYILNFIDRNNAGAARLRGFEEDLGLKGQQFATVLSILYVGYISMQIPSNVFMNHIGKPSIYLPACMAVWGLISVMTGFAHNFFDVLLTRLLLGVVEASFFPGALFLISKWYKHSELGSRTALLFCGNIISNAFGALIASAILDHMDGVLGRAAWRWLFYIEGSLTVLAALLAMAVLPDFPETTRAGWLTEAEVRLAVRRMHEDADAHAAPGARPAHAFVLAVRDPNVWILVVAMFFQVVSNSFTAWFPTIVATLGYSRTATLLLCAPPYVCTAVLTYFVSRHSDAKGERFYHITLPIWTSVAGLLLALCTLDVRARYLSFFLMTQSYAGFSVFYGWMSNSVPSPPAKRAVALALVNALSQLGNVAGAYVWQPVWAPRFAPSFAVCAAASAAAVGCCVVLRRRLVKENARLKRVEVERGVGREGFRYLV
ncbi:MFS general substrate transporter [Phanerochaete sordida]|uniref:MFS general substrate transporter n=1 Tax=Phanerochaete sordida TaxID=48140 RepID=A0A9P3L7Z6_9APHY|nr:MFS general substrate transporter [Phanerochaete sordida]